MKVGPPGEQAEIIGVDTWSNLEGLVEHYDDATALAGIGDSFAGAPSPSTWEQATGFNEW